MSKLKQAGCIYTFFYPNAGRLLSC